MQIFMAFPILIFDMASCWPTGIGGRKEICRVSTFQGLKFGSSEGLKFEVSEGLKFGVSGLGAH